VRKPNSLWRNCVAMLGMSLALVTLPVPATAVTHAPCKHYAGTPYIDYVNDSVVYLQAGGGVLGCPSPIGNESVTVTVNLRSSVDGVGWVVESTCSQTKGWNRHWRYARSAGCSVPAVACHPGLWQVQLTGVDSAPFEQLGPTVSFAASDGYDCGEPGGAIIGTDPILARLGHAGHHVVTSAGLSIAAELGSPPFVVRPGASGSW
jgi:hypothetical protein